MRGVRIFYAPAQRDLHVELPAEDTKGDSSMLGKLRLSLHGTRDAANNWQETLTKHLLSLGYARGVGFPSCFYDPKRQLWTLVHGDDYVTAGDRSDLEWLEQKDLSATYDIKTQHVGPRDDGFTEGKVLNRIIRWGHGGWQLEADPVEFATSSLLIA